MKLAVSNIAWPAALDAAAFELLRKSKIEAIELAPSRVWPEWQFTPDDAAAMRARLEGERLHCSSFQAVLYGKPELKLFASPAARAALIEHMRHVADLAALLGARPMVFGAPAARDRGALGADEAFAIAVETFAAIGEHCARKNVCLCIEPNPPVYGCNFVTDSVEGARLVRAVGSPGFRLHLDAAAMHLAGEDAERAIAESADVLEHLHISEPNLGTFEHAVVDHAAVARGLRAIGWRRWVVIEMRPSATPLSDLQTAIAHAKRHYGD